MMRLSTLAKVDFTVGDDGSSRVAERMLERWAYDHGSVRFFRSSANFIYRFRQQANMRFLRFADASERSRVAIEAEMAILEAVAGAGITIVTPVVSKHGNAVETVDTEWGTFHAVVFSALEDQQYELDELPESGFQQWGEALGRLHAATSAIAPLPARPTWSDHVTFIQDHLPADSPGLHTEFAELVATISALPASQETNGLIHGDFELDNLVWNGAHVGILDFDDCSRLWYAADVAFALRDLFAEGADTGDPRFRAFAEGYRTFFPLSEENVGYVRLFLRFAHLLNYARIVRSMDLTPGTESPEWLQRLNSKLLHRMAAYRASVESRRS
ncbi:MAG TPA: phosphotransferase, partial [Ktedonobacterales bacterium]|jgi:Ser/Thr protein kinase RdoA (MazF antagonist)